VISLTITLAAFASLLQSYELFKLTSFIPSLSRSLPKVIDSNYKHIIILQILISILLLLPLSLPEFAIGLLLAVVLICTFITSIKWGGALNGGSDAMSIQVFGLLALSCLLGTESQAGIFCIYLLIAQFFLSYVKGGLYKIRQKSWRTGTALMAITKTEQFQVPFRIAALAQQKKSAFVFSWLIILFEILFPFLLLWPKTTVATLIIGVLFHLMNLYSFGLNRFFWIWISTYPLLYSFSLSFANNYLNKN
jgi:hypothetical protein